MDHVLPPVALRQWVLSFPFAWRRRLAQDAALLVRLYGIFVDTVLGFYSERAAEEGAQDGRSGAFTAVQRANSDMRLIPTSIRSRSTERGTRTRASCNG
ncbi:MAG: hypothetical protein HYU66_14085, partial [Armatimonadetes bacterium]|nr:hypothetical protein [Armatimonadota bacterium]